MGKLKDIMKDLSINNISNVFKGRSQTLEKAAQERQIQQPVQKLLSLIPAICGHVQYASAMACHIR